MSTPLPGHGIAGRLLDGTPAHLANAAAWALEHFYHADRANAAIHMSEVRYSPITFELANALAGSGARGPIISTVLADAGHYLPDLGRVADDPV